MSMRYKVGDIVRVPDGKPGKVADLDPVSSWYRIVTDVEPPHWYRGYDLELITPVNPNPCALKFTIT